MASFWSHRSSEGFGPFASQPSQGFGPFASQPSQGFGPSASQTAYGFGLVVFQRYRRARFCREAYEAPSV